MSGVRILLVEDENRIREMVKEYLENEGFVIDEAADGAEALDKFGNSEYDMLVLDVMIPKVDGWSVCREIRRASSIPILMLTARGEEYDKLFGFELGVDDYIVKPFSPKELVARIKAVLRRSSNSGSNAYSAELFEYKGLLVNMSSRKVTIDERNIDMTPREFDLMSFFIKNRDRVFTREQLLNKVWGYEFGGDFRTVDTHIKMLRESLGEYRNLLVTVWGVGYKFEAEDTK
ncbi:MAG TPA: response regulator transcription factor [Bacillota bacterium]|nr:response regulator transcription factor [Bacillota bacterium]HNT03824.1 response regulator transcription factor [Bacillota bacterium]HPA55106.1 response regulator transcription factor [Bacillota bacterium]HPX69153.1 response regulator transcription factor [Bacillota bacterium]HQA65837.1 response regulator transcription factor [Bacillota bacterium]